ncbi:MAG TPA: aspartate 1-decarboxylase [Beutenbergiaceae bacterium]|nr:aspartate 1-decarboxylase [Beutenbergiaceae bacterium]
MAQPGSLQRPMLIGKIHRATVTAADLHYVGSLTLDTELLQAANLLPGQQVDVVDITNGARLTTYVIPGEPGSGQVQINGAAAHHVHPGDLVIIIAYGMLSDADARSYDPAVVFVDDRNQVISTDGDPGQVPDAPGADPELRPSGIPFDQVRSSTTIHHAPAGR